MQLSHIKRPISKNEKTYFCFLQKDESKSLVAQSCPTLHDPMDCSLPGSSIHGIFQARVLEWGAIAFSQDQVLVHPILVRALFLIFRQLPFFCIFTW